MKATDAAPLQSEAWSVKSVARACLSGLARVDLFTPQWGYVLRSTLAAALALGLAYLWQLETPYSAASTVLLVANANHGAVLAKGGWRIIGTLVGGAVALVLMGLFVQAPALFILGFAVWLGLCTGAAMMLRHFRASGAAVAGYTIGLATYGALEHPDAALEHVLGRIATVVLGVLCLSLVTALLSSRSTPSRLLAAFGLQVATVGREIAARLASKEVKGPAAPAARIGELFALDDLMVLARAESAEMGLRAGAVREGQAALFAAWLGGFQWRPDEPHALLERARGLAAEALDAACIEMATPDGLGPARLRLEAARRCIRMLVDEAEPVDDKDLAALVQLDRLTEMLEDYELAVLALAQARSGCSHRPFRYHRDVEAAIDNGLRSCLAILCAGALWIATGWSDGALMLLILAPYCSLLAMTGNPAAGAVAFLKGTLAAVPASFLCAFLILPRVDGFPLLIASLAPFWIAGLHATTRPTLAFAALAYLVAFNTLVAAANPMALDVAAYCNQVLGWLAGVAVTLICFRLILPRDPGREAQRIAGAIRDDALVLARNLKPRDRLAFEHLQHHRLSRIALILKGDPARLGALIDESLAGVHLGRALLRIRRALEGPSFPAELQGSVLAALRPLQGAGHGASGSAGAIRDAAVRLLHGRSSTSGACDQSDRDIHRVTAALEDIATLLQRHTGLLAARDNRTC